MTSWTTSPAHSAPDHYGKPAVYLLIVGHLTSAGHQRDPYRHKKSTGTPPRLHAFDRCLFILWPSNDTKLDAATLKYCTSSEGDFIKTKLFKRELEVRPWNHAGAGLADTMGMEHIDGLYGYALILTRNYAEAEDLVQETYVRAIQAVGRLRAGSNIQGWLFTILRNIWFNQLRKRRNAPQMIGIKAGEDVSNQLVDPSKNSHDIYVSQTETEQIRTAIQELPRQFREVILLREYEELSYQEISSILNCPIGTVMSRLGRARAKLRALIRAK